LRGVAESSGEGSGGLGLKIVTVQIKEAVVSSTRLWENLQKPFRADREKIARLAELQSRQEIAARELANRQATETAEIETARQLAELRARQRREEYDREQAEAARRYQLERDAERARRLADEELALQQHELEAKRVARELETVERQLSLEKAQAQLEKAKAVAGIERGDLEHQARVGREGRDVELLGKRRAVENELSEAHVRAQLIARLPEIAQAMPKPDELWSVSVNGDGASALTGLVAQLMGVIEGALPHRASNGK
jgi:flotillin